MVSWALVLLSALALAVDVAHAVHAEVPSVPPANVTKDTEIQHARLRQVVGADNRVPYNPFAAPGRFVGRILSLNGGGFSICTATLVGRDRAITAAHCVNEASLATTTFSAQYYSGRSSYTSGIRGMKRSIAQDWAMLYLEKPLGALLGFAMMHPLSQAAYSSSMGPVTLIGFSADRFLEVAGANYGCHVLGTRPALRSSGYDIVHDCDTAVGASGAALLQPTGQGWSVVGVHFGVFGSVNGACPTEYILLGLGARAPASDGGGNYSVEEVWMPGSSTAEAMALEAPATGAPAAGNATASGDAPETVAAALADLPPRRLAEPARPSGPRRFLARWV